MVTNHIELQGRSVLVVEVDVGELPKVKADEFILKVKEEFTTVFNGSATIMVVPMGRVRISAISL